MEIRRFTLMALLLLCMSIVGVPLQAQDNEPLTMLVDAGFDRFYRPGYWLPLQIQVRNDGLGFTGRLTVRPETSGRAVNSAYSTPIDLPTGSDKTVFLYIQAQPTSGSVIVELIDDEGVRVADQVVGITAIHPNDALYMVVSSTGASSIPLNSVAQIGYAARQGRWEVDNLPPDIAAFDAIDTLILYDVPGDEFSIDQLEAIEGWVAMGGHLIVIGGPGWAQTTLNLPDSLLPFRATGSENIDDISPIAAYIHRDDPLEARTFITTGDVNDNAQVLIETEDGLPLLIRQELGLGAVDFLTVDPTLEPLRSWEGMRDFWFTNVTNLPPEPGWHRGLLELQDAARSLAILPNVELLPPASSMILFIAAYIFLIGPVNYFVLSRLGRRAWAWLTIPLLIVAFTMLAWNVGFNLRGNEIIVSRLFVVQSFPETEIAYQEELVGVLSPRRETYTINAPENTVMGILPGVEDDSPFSANVTRSTADISQGQTFVVEDIAIDGGIFANFNLSSTVPRPDISGSATFSYLTDALDEEAAFHDPTPLAIRGVIRNDSDITLHDLVIVTRNRFYRVEGDLEPGDVLDFDDNDFEFINSATRLLIPVASPFQTQANFDALEGFRNQRGINESLVTSRVLLNIDWSTQTIRRDETSEFDSTDEEMSRRRALLRSFMRDQFGTGGIGNQVYVFAWTNEEQPPDVTVSDVPYRAVDTTLHIIELETEVELPPSSEEVTLSADQFTWALTDIAIGQVSGSPNELTIINPGWAEFQIMPLEGAVLSDVSTILVEVNRGTSLGRQIDMFLWNHETLEWDILENSRLEEYIINDPAPYLGRDNLVNLRLAIDTDLTSSNANGRVLQIRVIQKGTF